jgi:membrane-bound metal-dependent hydrolase YbcI (DUF457 family)
MFPFGHLIIAWLVGLGIQKLAKVNISRLGWGLLLLGGLLPDVDYLFDFILGNVTHRMFTHSLLFVLVGFFVIYFILRNFDLEKEAYFLPIGIFIHILVDLLTYPGALLFWPLGTWFWFFGIANKGIIYTSASSVFAAKSFFVLFDVALGLIWLAYLYLKGKINFN